MRHGSLFSGIGGFDLAADWMGWKNVFHCEWNEFGRRVLNYYWPEAESFEDITKTDFRKYAEKIDILTGGFPCQPYSQAGKRLGKEDDRHLWPEMLRAIREIKPRYVVGENVLGIVNWNGGLVFEEVCADLEAEGYEVQPIILPAAGVNAPHQRYRVWFVAHRCKCGCGYGCNNWQGRQVQNDIDWDAKKDKQKREGRKCRAFEVGCVGNAANTNGPIIKGQYERCTGQGEFNGCNCRKNHTTYWENFPTQSPICGGDDGIPTELDGITFPKWRNESIKAYGNAIVPQVAYEIFKAIQQCDS